MWIGLAWVFCVEGMGWATFRSLRLESERYQRLIVGASVFIFLGGCLNAFGAISAWSMWALWIIGFSGWWNVDLRFLKKPWVPHMAYLLIVLACSSYWGRPTFTNEHDDFHAYWVYPIRMLQEGHLHADPWSERLVFSLGGMHFLQAMFLSIFSIETVSVVDVVLGTAVLVAAAIDGVLVKRWSGFWAGLLVWICFFAVLPKANVSALVLLWAFLVGLTLWLQDIHSAKNPKLVCLFGLAAGGLMTLKSNMALPVIGILGVSSLWLVKRQGLRSSRWWIVALVAGVFGTMSPWIFNHWSMYDTPMFPLLGKGNHVSSFETNYPLTYWHPTLAQWFGLMTATLFSPIKLLWFSVPLWFRGKVSFGYAVFAAVLLVVFPALAWVAGETIDRYAWPLEMCMHFLVIVSIALKMQKTKIKSGALSALYAAVFGVVLWLGYGNPIEFRKYMMRQWALVRGEALSDTTRTFWRNLQLQIPKGEGIAVHIDLPFLLDFERNKIMAIDVPGVVGPEGGVPILKGFDRTRDYLLKHGFRYLVYSAKTEANFPKRSYGYRMTDMTIPISAREDAIRIFALHDAIATRIKQKTGVQMVEGVAILDLRILPQ